MTVVPHSEITPKLVETLYVEAMTLADSARRYFDLDGADDRLRLDPATRVTFSCEALKVTTRLMHVVAWLMVRKAVEAGELSEEAARAPERRLGRTPEAAPASQLVTLPAQARIIIDASDDLYERIRRLDVQLGAEGGAGSGQGARALLDKLQASL